MAKLDYNETNKGGRPTVITQEVLTKLEMAFSIGATDNEACLFAEISPASLYNYQKENPNFLEKKEQLKLKPILKARQEVVNGIDKNPEFAMKYLEKKARDEFGSNTGNVNINVLTQIEEKTDKLENLIKYVRGEKPDTIKGEVIND